MKHWSIRCDSPKVHLDDADEPAQIRIYSSRNIHITARDKLVLMKRLGYDFIFTHSCTVQSVDMEESDRIELGLSYYFNLRKTQKFTRLVRLSDLSYSLLKIYRNDRPELHFRYPYGHLNVHDHTTIIENQIFYARTAFLMFYRAMPVQLRLEFDGALLEAQQPGDVGGLDYQRRWKHLQEFLDNRVLKIGGVLTQLEDLWRAMEDTGAPPLTDQIFSADGEPGEALIRPMQSFSWAWTSLGNEVEDRRRDTWLGSLLWQEAADRMQQDQEERLERIFRLNET